MIYVEESQVLRSDCDIIINLTDIDCRMEERLSINLLRTYPRLKIVWGKSIGGDNTRFKDLFELINIGNMEVVNLLSYSRLTSNNNQNIDIFIKSLTSLLNYLTKNKYPRGLKIGLPYDYPLSCGVEYHKIISEVFEHYGRDVYLYKR